MLCDDLPRHICGGFVVIFGDDLGRLRIFEVSALAAVWKIQAWLGYGCFSRLALCGGDLQAWTFCFVQKV